ncbi:MAG: phosphodiester glycosidase family protein [Terricaulis sp.]
MRRRRIFCLLVLLLAGVCASGCAPKRRNSAAEICQEQSFEGDGFVVCAYDSRVHELRLASRWRGRRLRSLAELAQMTAPEAGRVRFGMNAGMFNDAGEPIGLYVERGDRQQKLSTSSGPGNFHMLPNGVFSEDRVGVLRIETSQSFAARAASPYWATQSGPMLVIDDALHPNFGVNGESRVLRNGVGVRSDHLAYFVISAGPVSLGRFARFFRDHLHCPNALFLDGAVSSLWAPSLKRRDAGHALGPMLVVLDG